MEKRKLISLRAVLLRYLVQTALACVLTVVLWFGLLLVLIGSGFCLPANRAARLSNEAVQNILQEMTAETFEPSRLDPLCRYVLFAGPDSDEVLATNLDARHMQWALEDWRGARAWHLGYTQYYMDAKLRDGTICRLQFDYAVPYADPTLRAVLPDLQMTYLVLGLLLLVGVVAGCTHRTGTFLAGETVRLTEVSRQVAEKKGLEGITFTGAQVREYDEALRALQLMGGELTESLQRQWQMEQQQREQIIQLAHELKTPLTVIQGNAELLAEDEGLTEEQKEQIAAILSGVEQTRRCTLKIRAEVQTPLKYKKKS